MVRAVFDFGISEILNPDDLTCQVKFDQSISANLTLIEGELRLTGEAYKILYDAYKGFYCNVYACRLQIECAGVWNTIAIGEIYTSDCEFDIDRCILTVPFNDLGFSSSINPNKSIVVAVNADKSKNELAITGAVPVEVAFASFSGVGVNPPSAPYPIAYRMGDVFRCLIAYMSDGKVNFASDYFTTGFGRRYFLTTGKSLRANANSVPRVSFEDLYDFFRKRRNLAFGFTIINNQVTIKIEPASYFQNGSTILTLTQLSNVVRAVDKSRIYSAINVGTTIFKEFNDCDSGNTQCGLVQFPYVAFKDEQFALCGQCNLDNVLDLRSSDIACDSNVIQDCIQFGATDNDDTAIVLDSITEYNINIIVPGSPFVIQNADPLGINQPQFNPSLTNEQSIAAWVPDLPCGVFDTLAGFDETKLPASGEFTSATEPIQSILLDDDYPAPLWRSAFDYVGFSQYYDLTVDPGSNLIIDDGTIYVSPALQYVNVTVDWNLANVTSNAGQIVATRVSLIIEDASGLELRREVSNETTLFAQIAPVAQLSETFTNVLLNIGDRVRFDFQLRRVNNIATGGGLAAVEMIVRPTNITNPYQTTFNLTFSEFLLNGLLQPSDPDFSARIAKFNYPINRAQFGAILSNPTGIIKWSEGTQLRSARISNANINGLGTKFETDFELIEI